MKAAFKRLLVVLVCCAGANAVASSEVSDVLVDTEEGVTTATVVLSSPSSYRVFMLPLPDRVVVDIRDARLVGSFDGPADLPTSPVTALRHGYQDDGRLRLVFDLDQPVTFTDRLVTDDSGGSRIELELKVATLPLVATQESVAASADEPVTALDGDEAEGTAPVVGDAPAAPAEAAGAPGPAGSGSLVFGAARKSREEGPDRETSERDDTGRWTPRLQRGLVESGYLYADDDAQGSNLHLQFVGTLTGKLTDNLELRLGGRYDGHVQGGDAPDYDLSEFDYDETWLRYRAGDWRLTLGGQRIVWGRADEISPTDRLSTRDFTRFILDDLRDRRRANPAARLEWFGENTAVDLVYLPQFREAELPGSGSIWSPVDAERGAIAGLRLDPQAQAALQGAVLENDVSGDGGGGVRIRRFGSAVDYAVTLQRVRNPEPYFALREQGPGGPVLETVYPRTWVAGGDVGLAVANWTFRFEGAWLSDQAYTGSDFVQRTTDAVNWVLGGEVFPGDRNLRLTIQVAGTHLIDADNPIDRENILALTGELEGPFGGNRWRGQLRWWAGLNRHDLYLNPEIVFTGWEPSELYLGLNIFDGDRGTLGDFYGRNDMIVIGWRGRF